jgi:hypothetical protein
MRNAVAEQSAQRLQEHQEDQAQQVDPRRLRHVGRWRPNEHVDITVMLNISAALAATVGEPTDEPLMVLETALRVLVGARVGPVWMDAVLMPGTPARRPSRSEGVCASAA